MGYRIRMSLIALNTLGLVFCLVLYFFAAVIAPLGSAMRVTALDRAGVIDTGKLATFRPELAESLRSSLPRWIAQGEREAGLFNAVIAALLCTANAAVLLFVVRPIVRPPLKPWIAAAISGACSYFLISQSVRESVLGNVSLLLGGTDAAIPTFLATLLMGVAIAAACIGISGWHRRLRAAYEAAAA